MIRRIALCGVLLLAGCKTTYRNPIQLKMLQSHHYDAYPFTLFRTKYDDYLMSGDMPKAKIARDQIIGELMAAVEMQHGEYEREMRFRKTTGGIAFDFAELGLTGAAAMVGGAEVKGILAAIATGVKGAELSVNRRVWEEMTLQAVQSQMRSAMISRKAQILLSMEKPVSNYSLELGLADVSEMFYDGTITRAMQALVKDANASETVARGALLKAKRIKEPQ